MSSLVIGGRPWLAQQVWNGLWKASPALLSALVIAGAVTLAEGAENAPGGNAQPVSVAPAAQTVVGAAAMEDSTAPLSARLDSLWARSDWDAAVQALEWERANGSAESAAWLKEKLYAAYINAGNRDLRSGNKALAESRFTAARTLDPARLEATDGLKRLPLAGAMLEVLPGGTCTKKLGFFRCEGTVRNISGKPMPSVMAVYTYRTAAGEDITTTRTFVQGKALLPDQVSAFATFTRENPAIASWQVSFKVPFGSGIPHYQDP